MYCAARSPSVIGVSGNRFWGGFDMAFRHFVAAGVIGIAASTAARADSITYANFLSTAGLTLVGTTGQIFSVQSVAVPKSKDEPTHEQLRSRVY